MIDPQTIEPNVLIHEMKKSERKKDEIAKEKDDPEKVAQEKSRVKSDLERNYRGFNMPADMDEDQEKDYKAAIDKRKEELAGVEDERAIERGKEALEGVAKSATELPGDIGEVVASVPPVASHLIGSALVAKRKAYEDPTEAIRKAREFGSKVFEGDPEAQEQALIGTSMSMVEPAATAADVELARRDIRKALETRKAGDIATAGVSTVFAGIPVLGVAHFKIMKKSVDDIDEVLPEIAKVSDANRAEVAKYEDFRGKFMAHAADISDRKFSDKELEVLIDPFRSDAVRELSKTNPNIYGDLLDELRRAGVEDDRVADYLDRASAMHQMTKGGDAAGDIAGSLNELRRELKQYNPENLTESRKALDEATKAANDVKSELSAAEAALKRLQQTAPKYVPRSDPGHDEYVAAVREWSRTNRVKERAIKKDIERITGDSYFEYVRPGGSSVKLDILERNLDNARKRVETLEKGPLENDDVRYLIDGLKDKVRGINSPGLDKETRNKIRRIIDDIEAKPGGTPGGGTPGGGAGGGPMVRAGRRVPAGANPDRFPDGTIFEVPGTGRGYLRNADAPARQRYTMVRRVGDDWVPTTGNPISALQLRKFIKEADTDTPNQVFVFGRTIEPEIKAGKAADVAKGARAAKLENLTDLKGNTPKLNEDGTITLYHRTTPEAAAEIRRTGKFISKENTDEVFLSSKRTGQAEGYGSEVVEVRVDPDKVRLDDAFDDEIHVAVKTADVAKPPASATMKLPETRQEIDAAFRELGDLQNDRPETAMYDMQRSKASTLWSQTAEHVGDIIRRMTPSGPGEMYRPPEMDIIPKTRRGIADLSGDIEGGIRGQAGTEAKLNELRALGQKYADEHRKLPVYNELQMLANDAAIALGEGRFADSKAALVKLDQIYRENPRKFSDRLEVVEPEFARPGSTAAKPPAAKITPVKTVKTIGQNKVTSSVFSLPGGKIEVFEDSPFSPNHAHSIFEFVVDESKRGQGVGSQLVDEVLRAYPDKEISAQVSSLASLKVFHNKGFRHQDTDMEFDDLAQLWKDEGGSLNMRRTKHPAAESDDYRVSHQPLKGPSGDEIGITDDFPKDILQHPDWYVGSPTDWRKDKEAQKFWKKVVAGSGNPDAKVTIYRAMPKSAGSTIEKGNWVTPSKTYAEDHAFGEEDWHVVAVEVPLRDINWAGDDLMEWGYWGSNIKPPAATDIATAGAYTPAEIEEAKALWVEKGIESPHFKRWSGGIEPTQIPSESLTPKLSTGDNAGWENYSREALNDKYADAYKRLLAQVPNPDNLKYIDQVAYTPDVLVVHHSTPGMRGTTIDYDAGRSFGFHAGTTEAAQHREYRLARSSRADELANPFEPKPPPHPIGQGRIQPSYDAERVFYFKYNKLLPLPDGYGWGAKSVLLDSIKSAERLNEKKFAADLKKYLDDAELRVRNAGLDWDGSANLRLNEAVEAQSVRDIYKKHGFDGVIYTNIAEDPGSLSIIAIDDSSLKLAADAPDLGKVTGEFKPTGLYGAGAAVPAAAAVRSQREDEL